MNPISNIRVICKVRKRQHENPEFGDKPGEIRKQPAEKEY
jgi:hypothetical protein